VTIRVTEATRVATGRHTVVLLGCLSALGPIGVDIYLPAFPRIAADLGCDVGAVQQSMAAYFLALSLGQLVYGPISDRIGRKPPICIGLSIFAIGALLAACSSSVAALIAARFVQGLGICAIIALIRAIVRDLHVGAEAAHMMARMLLIVSVSPLLAPLAGSAILGFASWRLIFVLLAVMAAALLLLTGYGLPETHHPTAASSAPGESLARRCWRLLADPGFRRPMLVLACAQAGASIYLASASQLYIVDYGLGGLAYGLVFAINAVGMIGLAQTNRWLIRRRGPASVLRAGTAGCAVAMLGVAATNLAGLHSIGLVLIGFFVYFSAFGLVMAPASVIALHGHPELSGTAAALLGTVQFASGAAATALAGYGFDGSAGPAISLQAVVAVTAWCAAVRIPHEADQLRRPPDASAESASA